MRKFGKAGFPGNRPRAGLVPQHTGGQRVATFAKTELVCSRVQDWLHEECNDYRSMRVIRAPEWGEVQQQVDGLAGSQAFGPEESIEEKVQIARAAGSEDLAAALQAKAASLVGHAVNAGLPEGLGQQIQLDIVEVGMVVAELLPAAQELKVKLELMGESVCKRWHQDHYTCRAIVTYNGPGTVYTDHENVDFWELNNCGCMDKILRDKDLVYSAGAGDIFFMKGKLFPGAANGLVHKSPEKCYYDDGLIMNRLCLKVDVH